MGGVKGPTQFSGAELASCTDPAALLERAWELEPWGRYAERESTLEALETLLDEGDPPPAPPGRDWRLELLAERAVDLGRVMRLDAALALIDEIKAGADPEHQIALGRTMLASGQALAWVGTDEATRRAKRDFAEAAARFAALGHPDWQGSALLRSGYSACYQHGDLLDAEALMRQAIETYPPGSQRLAGALTPYADVLIDLGEFDRAAEVLDRAEQLAEEEGIDKVFAEVAWGRAHVAAGRLDARATERLAIEAIAEVERLDYFDTHAGLSYLLEAAELLDAVGLTAQARQLLERAQARGEDPHGEIPHTTAVLDARSGDPGVALEELQTLARGAWLQKYRIWRHTLLSAWATFRAGRDGAGELAARGLEQAVACGNVRVAVAGEPEIVAALAPQAERAGSAAARELLLGERELLIRLFGTPSVTKADGTCLELPGGMPGELIRWLALNEHGLPTDVVLEAFFPEASLTSGRPRLRQVLGRVRASLGEIIVRDGDVLRLIPAWVDAREFLLAANRARGATGTRAVRLAYAGLALHDGPLLSTDPYAEWAAEPRAQIGYRHLELLDLVAADAAARGSHQEAVTALEAALADDPDDDDRRAAMTEQLRALDHHRAADFVERR